MNSNSPTHGELRIDNDMALLALATRLEDYAKQTNHPAMHCDLKIAAALISYLTRCTDDFK